MPFVGIGTGKNKGKMGPIGGKMVAAAAPAPETACGGVGRAGRCRASAMTNACMGEPRGGRYPCSPEDPSPYEASITSAPA